MVVITTALRSEARPIIRSLALVQDRTYPVLRIYGNEDYTLLITGVGSVSTEKALEKFFQHFSERRRLFLINVGIAGGDERQTKVGQMYLINKIVEASTGKTYFPDILLDHSLEEAALLTVEEAITTSSRIKLPLVDMEAAIIWKVAGGFLPPHHILFLKIVSDYRDGAPISAQQIQALIQKNIPGLLDLLRGCQRASFFEREILTPEEHSLLTECRQVLRLTHTQYYRLLNLAEGYKVVRGTDIIPVLKPYCTRTFTHKRERNRFFQTLCEQLAA